MAPISRGIYKRLMCISATFCLFGIIGLFEVAEANVGREFIVTFPEAPQNGRPDEGKIVVTMDTSNAIQMPGEVITVIVSMDSPFESSNVTLSKADPYEVILISDTNRIFPEGNARGQQYVVHLLSDGDVTVGVRNGAWSNRDLYLAMPVAMLGTTYYALIIASSDSSTAGCPFIALASTKSPTNVKITLPSFPPTENTIDFENVTYRRGDTMELSLLPLEGVQLTTSWDLTGVKIESDHPVAVWTGVNRTFLSGTHASHLVMQTPSAKMAGRRFVFLPVPVNAPTVEMRILAVQSWPIVTVHFYNDSTRVLHMSKKGSVCQLTLAWASDKAVLVESTKDVLVYRIATCGEGSPPMGGQAMAVLSPLDKTLPSTFTFLTHLVEDADDNLNVYISIVVQASEKDALTLNGESFQTSSIVTSHTSVTVPGSSDLAVEVILLTTPTNQDLGYGIVDSPSGAGFTGVLDVVDKKDGESMSLSYPILQNSTSDENDEDIDNSECCVDINHDGTSVATIYNDVCFASILDAPDPCCLADYERVTCQPSKLIYSCEFQDYAQTASSVKVVYTSSALACFRSCLSSTDCVGANFDINDIHGNDNCQLLFGYRLERNRNSPYRHIACTITSYFEI